jgi:hypothetical protein
MNHRANDSSLGSASDFFDFDTQSGVMHLLASVRASSLSTAEKNELRDLVFLYSNGGHDQSVRHNLEQKLTQYNIAPVAKPSTFTPPKVHEFGASRPSPAFKAHPVKKTAPAAVSTPASTPSVQEKPTPTPTPAQPQPQPQSQTAPATEEAFAEMAQAVAQAAPANLPQAAVSPEPKVVAPEEVSTPEPSPAAVQPEVSATPVSEVSTTDSQVESLQRIKEIKSLVNEKVGNPVNLVDINNEVGREYMAALLDAMKKINSGSSAASAMQRLESAYSSVESALKEHDAAEKSAVANDAPAPAPVPETRAPQTPEVKTETPASPAQPSVAPEPQKAPSQHTFSPISVEQTKSIETEQAMDSRPIVPLSQSEPVGQKTMPAQPAPVAQTAPAEVKSSHEQPSAAWGPETDELPKQATAPVSVPAESKTEQQQVPTPNRFQSASLAESPTKLRTPDDLPNASALETSSVAGDPLFTKQVDDGLNQLLSDWVLFKKSGLFGTGPKGMSHPLYLKIKDLQIPLLLAGRFEGATQEIKQSVTDYMNGWRYEQGIIYEQGETFDHYLRRVIRHILDLQKNL